MKEKKPYVSIIMPSRNDNYDGDALGRLQASVDNFILQAKKYNLDAELIIIDWNPPKDRPLLKDALALPKDLGPLVIRFIVVPHQLHKTYKYSDKINMIYPAALNVGLRRAEGEFVWPTNADLLFSNELMEFISQKKFKKDRFYRAWRCSVHQDVLKCNSLQERMDFCANNIVQVLQKNTVPIIDLAGCPVLQVNFGGDFTLFSKEHCDKLNGFPELNNLGSFTDWLLCYMLYLSGLKEEMLPDLMRVYHIDHRKHQERRKDFSKGITNRLRYKIFPKLDNNNKLKILIRKINNFKNKTYDFFAGIFYRFGSSDLSYKYLRWEFYRALVPMLKKEKPYAYNNDNWGLPKEDFVEFIIKNQS